MWSDDGLVIACFLSMKLYRGLSSVVSGLLLPWASHCPGVYIGPSSVVSVSYFPGLPTVLVCT